MHVRVREEVLVYIEEMSDPSIDCAGDQTDKKKG